MEEGERRIIKIDRTLSQNDYYRVRCTVCNISWLVDTKRKRTALIDKHIDH